MVNGNSQAFAKELTALCVKYGVELCASLSGELFTNPLKTDGAYVVGRTNSVDQTGIEWVNGSHL